MDEKGDIFVGDRFNHVVRMIDHQTGVIETIAGKTEADSSRRNAEGESDPLNLNLPEISSMDYFQGRLLVPTDLAQGAGDLAVLRRT